MTDLNALPALTSIATGDQFLIRDKSDTTDGVNGTDKYINFSNLNPLLLQGNMVKLTYKTTAVSGVAANGWYIQGASTAAVLTGRTATITWEGTSAQIPTQGTGSTNFQVGDTALVRAASL